jgi:phage terminase small subunit
MTKLTSKQESFCQAILAGLNQSNAYRKAYDCRGMKAETIHVRACELRNDSKIAVRIEALMKPVIAGAQMSRAEALSIAAMVGRHDARKMFDRHGNPKEITELEENEAMSIEGFEFYEAFAGNGESRKAVGYTKKFKLRDRLKAIELIAKIRGYYRDEEEGDVSKVPPRVEVVFVDATGANVHVNMDKHRVKPKVQFVG